MHAGNQFISKVLHIEITAVDLRRSPFIWMIWTIYHFPKSSLLESSRAPFLSGNLERDSASTSVKTEECKNEWTETRRRSIESIEVARVELERRTETESAKRLIGRASYT